MNDKVFRPDAHAKMEKLHPYSIMRLVSPYRDQDHPYAKKQVEFEGFGMRR
jgi:hypothetical protein